MAAQKKRLTIKDVAKIAGVSASTVSNALSGERHVNKETKKKIFDAVKKYRYTPNIIARGLSKKKTGIIGIIIPDINNPFYAEVVRGIDEEAKRRDYLPLVVSTYYDDDVEIAQINKLGSLFVDGYIFVGGTCGFERVLSSISYMGGFVLVNRYCRNGNFSSVIVDSEKAIKTGVDHLYTMGHRHIGYVGWRTGETIIPENKYRGYLRGLEENRMTGDRSIIFMAKKIITNQYSYGYNVMAQYLRGCKKPAFTALICQTDIIALGVMRALQDKGLSIPEDISILGYGNLDAAKFSNPAVSSIDIPKKRMGLAGAAILFDSISRLRPNNQRVYFKAKIIERESIARVT